MSDANKSGFYQRLHRYRQHHNDAAYRYDIYHNAILEREKLETRELHQRWLKSRSRYVVEEKRLKLSQDVSNAEVILVPLLI